MFFQKFLIDIYHRGLHEIVDQNLHKSNLVDNTFPYNLERTDMERYLSNSTKTYKEFEYEIGTLQGTHKLNLPFRIDRYNTVQTPMKKDTYFTFIIPSG